MIRPTGKSVACQIAVGRSAKLALVTALAVPAGCLALAVQPSPAVAQTAFHEQYELDLGRSAPETENDSSPAALAPPPAAAEPPEAAPTEGSPGRGAGVDSPARTSPPTGLSTAASGELPLAGYPLTPFVLLLLAFLLGGFAVRAGLAVRDRLDGRGPGPPRGAR